MDGTFLLAMLVLADDAGTAMGPAEVHRVEVATLPPARVLQLERDGGPIELVPAARAAPGDAIVYTLRFTYLGDATADPLDVVYPMPDTVDYVPGTAVGPGAESAVSVDGGSTWTDDDPESTSDARVTHLRWTITVPVEPGVAGVLSFRGVVRAADPP